MRPRSPAALLIGDPMRRTLTLMLISLTSVVIAACTPSTGGSGAALPPETAAGADNPCAQPSAVKEGETPSCAEGCKWNGTECRQERSIIVHDNK
jgi:hypothetical protein